MEQRLEFVVRWSKHDASMAELCRQFGISRKSGYYWLAQYRADGVDGLKPHSRAAHHHPNAISDEVCAAVLRAKAAHPSWGPKKLGLLPGEPEHIRADWPVASTRGAILARAGLTVPDLVRRFVQNGAGLLVNISDDAWFGNTAGARQHLAHACMRAIENDRDLVRVTNSGITALITPGW